MKAAQARLFGDGRVSVGSGFGSSEKKQKDEHRTNTDYIYYLTHWKFLS
jgi:hypothetical protein